MRSTLLHRVTHIRVLLAVALIAAIAFVLVFPLQASAAALDGDTAYAAAAPAFAIPVAPAGIVLLVGFLSPFAIAVVNQSFWPAGRKKAVAVAVSLVLTAAAIAIYYFASGDPLPSWWVLLLVGVTIAQTSYALVFKGAATRLEEHTTSET